MKLYLVGRGDLSVGPRAAQVCHAFRSFVDEHPAVDRKWFEESNTLVLLQVDTEKDLQQLKQKAVSATVEVSAFHEPDLGGALTALAIGPAGKRLVRGLPLMG